MPSFPLVNSPFNNSLVGTQDGLTPFAMVNSSGAAALALQVFNGPGQVFGLAAGNTGGAVRYLKFFDLALGSNVSGATGNMNFIIPGNSAGAGSNVIMNGLPHNAGVQFQNGLVVAITGNIALTDQSGVGGQDTNVTLWWR